MHWGLLAGSVIGPVIFTAICLIDGLHQPGYHWLSQPMSALSLGPGGRVQVVNFVLLGLGTCVSSLAWRPALADGRGSRWYPRLVMLSGLALIGAGVFAADPGGGYPAGGPAAASPSVHGVLHDVAYYGNLTAMLIGLVILARRFSTESGWRGWSAAAMAAAGLMVTFVATYAVLAAQGGPAGVFDRLALLTPYVFGVVLVVRLIAARDARVAGQDRFVAVAEAE